MMGHNNEIARENIPRDWRGQGLEWSRRQKGMCPAALKTEASLFCFATGGSLNGRTSAVAATVQVAIGFAQPLLPPSYSQPFRLLCPTAAVTDSARWQPKRSHACWRDTF